MPSMANGINAQNDATPARAAHRSRSSPAAWAIESSTA